MTDVFINYQTGILEGILGNADLNPNRKNHLHEWQNSTQNRDSNTINSEELRYSSMLQYCMAMCWVVCVKCTVANLAVSVSLCVCVSVCHTMSLGSLLRRCSISLYLCGDMALCLVSLCSRM